MFVGVDGFTISVDSHKYGVVMIRAFVQQVIANEVRDDIPLDPAFDQISENTVLIRMGFGQDEFGG